MSSCAKLMRPGEGKARGGTAALPAATFAGGLDSAAEIAPARCAMSPGGCGRGDAAPTPPPRRLRPDGDPGRRHRQPPGAPWPRGRRATGPRNRAQAGAKPRPPSGRPHPRRRPRRTSPSRRDRRGAGTGRSIRGTRVPVPRPACTGGEPGCACAISAASPPGAGSAAASVKGAARPAMSLRPSVGMGRPRPGGSRLPVARRTPGRPFRRRGPWPGSLSHAPPRPRRARPRPGGDGSRAPGRPPGPC